MNFETSTSPLTKQINGNESDLSIPPVLYKYLDAEGAIKTLGNLSLKFSSPLSLNDPFEGLYGDVSNEDREELRRLLFDARYYEEKWVRICEERLGMSREIALLSLDFVEDSSNSFELWFGQQYQVFVDTMHRRFGKMHKDALIFKAITCFSAKWNDLLMWGHYADKHHGCVIGFDTEKLSGQVGTPLPVKYPEDNRRVPIPAKGNDALPRATEAMMTKPREWKYEEEWRIILKITDSDLSCNGGGFFHSFDPSIIREVIIGMRADDSLTQHMAKFWQMPETSCKLYYASLHRCDFAVERKSYRDMMADIAFGKGTHT